MRHFLLFTAAVFLGLFLLILNRQPGGVAEDKPVLRVYSYSSFSNEWGPGSVLKKIFEKDCGCRVEFTDGADAGILLQRLKIEGESLGADLVIGFDQYDLQKALVSLKWQKLDFGKIELEKEIQSALSNSYFVPYDWGALSFMARKDTAAQISSLDDLLKPELSRRILIQDPRTSSPGFQFLYWVTKSKGEAEGFDFLNQLTGHLQAVTPSWSASLGLFNKNPSSLMFSYVTSPLYYELEEKKTDIVVVEFREPLPIQVEFLGIPEFCRNCELSERFVNLMLSQEGQKVLMTKNYMLPVLRGVRRGTAFEKVLDGRQLINFEIPSDTQMDFLLKRWSEVRRGQGS